MPCEILKRSWKSRYLQVLCAKCDRNSPVSVNRRHHQLGQTSVHFAKHFRRHTIFYSWTKGTDWSEEHRDLIYDVFGPERVIVADGIDQFVNQDRCDWDRGDVPKNRIQPLYTSRRDQGCDLRHSPNDIAQRSFTTPDWDVKPDQTVTGGRVTVLVEPTAAPRA